MRLWKRINEAVGYVVNHFTLAQLIWAALSLSAISSWLSAGTLWFSGLGWFGILIAALIAFALFVWGAVGVQQLRRLGIRAKAEEAWVARPTTANPFAKEFHQQRIHIADLGHPLDKTINGRRFIDCDVLGPAVLFFNQVKFHDVRFLNCDVIALRPSSPPLIYNVFQLTDVEMVGGTMCNCTILVPPSAVAVFAQLNTQFLTLTGVKALDDNPVILP